MPSASLLSFKYLVQVLNFCHTRLNHPWVTFLEWHGLIPCILLGALWILAGWVRLQELNRVAALSFSKKRSSPPIPGNKNPIHITIVLPTRGYRSNSISNWEAILKLEYHGHIDFIFVVEHVNDSAHSVVSRLAHRACSGHYGPNRTSRVLLSGEATQTSQKIHNLIAGIKAMDAASRYVCCLDDDVLLHSNAIQSMINDLERNPDIRVATGYPFDIPAAKGASLLTYAALAYHLPLVIAFSVRHRTHFVWGGCMVFRCEDVGSDDRLGFLSSWSRGGYSDDLTIAARCTELGLDILCPSYAIFPQYLDSKYTFKEYWNYLRRQLVVLDTYSSDHNKQTNHTMALAHCYFSWAFVLPFCTVFSKLIITSLLLLINIINEHLGFDPAPVVFPDWSTWSSSTWTFATVFCFFTATGLRWMIGVVCALLEALRRSDREKRMIHVFDWITLWVGFVMANAMLPLCMVYTFMNSHIVWAGVKYTRRQGRIIKVEHIKKHM